MPVSLSAADCSPALVAAIPGASNIDHLETQHKSRFTHLHLTLLPQVTGQKNRWRLASPLHGTLTPGRISVGRPRKDGSIIVSDGIIAIQLAIGCFWSGGNRSAPSLWPFDRSTQGDRSPSLIPLLLQMVLAHPPLSLASLVRRPRQECIQVFGYEIFNVRSASLIDTLFLA